MYEKYIIINQVGIEIRLLLITIYSNKIYLNYKDTLLNKG